MLKANKLYLLLVLVKKGKISCLILKKLKVLADILVYV